MKSVPVFSFPALFLPAAGLFVPVLAARADHAVGIEREEDGRVTGFLPDTGRVEGLRFERE